MLGQLQPFVDVFAQERMGQPGSCIFWADLTAASLQAGERQQLAGRRRALSGTEWRAPGGAGQVLTKLLCSRHKSSIINSVTDTRTLKQHRGLLYVWLLVHTIESMSIHHIIESMSIHPCRS
jgi:hypothetical protein